MDCKCIPALSLNGGQVQPEKNALFPRGHTAVTKTFNSCPFVQFLPFKKFVMTSDWLYYSQKMLTAYVQPNP